MEVQVLSWAPSTRHYRDGFALMRLFRIYPVVIAASCFLLASCATSSGTIDPYVQKLQWLNAADPQADANQAVKTKDFRLLGLATRSVNIPGISKDESLKYEESCGVQLIEGISDVVRSDEHLRLMQKARSYALKYNAIIKMHCQP
ncbi:MAG: hypothetical protein GY802_28985 [Gammaproteobacteria bacterium]|nr:hypothetical protein [Gammaproteobacteria bacterium]